VGQVHVVEFIQRYKTVILFIEENGLVIETLSIKNLLVFSHMNTNSCKNNVSNIQIDSLGPNCGLHTACFRL